MLNDVVFERHEVNDERIDAFSAAISTTHVNGGLLLACFRPQIPLRGYELTRIALPEGIRAFVSNVSIRQALPDLGITDPVIFGNGCWQSSYELEGSLVSTLVSGGAYKSWRNQEEQARLVARNFVDVLAEGRREGLVVYRIFGAWTGWFFDIAWDSTHVAFHFDTGMWWIICSTDTD